MVCIATYISGEVMSSMDMPKTNYIIPPPLANDSLCPHTFQWEEGAAMAMLVYLTMQY